MAAKYYAVRKGRKPGIYRTWDACKSHVFKCEEQNIRALQQKQRHLPIWVQSMM